MFELQILLEPGRVTDAGLLMMVVIVSSRRKGRVVLVLASFRMAEVGEVVISSALRHSFHYLL